ASAVLEAPAAEPPSPSGDFPPSAAGPSTSAGGSRGRRLRGRRGRRRRVARLVRDLALEVLRHLREPALPGHLLLLLREVRLDLRLDFLERLRVGRLDRRDRLDDVPAELAVHRLRDLVRLEGERRLVERRHRGDACAALAAVRDTELAALRSRARVLRVLLRQRREARAV